MKNKKGFTLIELLAIIVILAIIAVITVPIILNVIENAKKGSVIDSAYGYKDAIQKYYLTKSVNSINQELPTGTYNITALPSDFDISGEHPTEGCVQLEKGRVTSFTLKFNDYIVTKANESDPIAEKGGEIPENSCSTQNGTTVADITTSDYGQYVDLGTNLLDLSNITLADNTNPEADWRVFYKDENGAWLILADYLPVGEGTIGASVISDLGLVVNGAYSVYGVFDGAEDGRENFISKLNENLSELLSGSNLTGITVKGAIDLLTWVASWNSNQEYTHLYTRYIDIDEFDDQIDATGYAISDSEPVESYYVDISSSSGYNDTLYFPHQGYINSSSGYWLSSPSCNIHTVKVVSAFDGLVIQDDYYFNEYYYAVRPVVYLPNSIGLDTTNDVWTIADDND